MTGLTSTIHALRSQLDASNRKATTVETILRTITQERDSAASQLSVAYVTIKQLEAENEDLKEENDMLKSSAQRLPKDHKDEVKTSRKSNVTNNGHRAATTAEHARSSNEKVSPAKATRFAKHSSRHLHAEVAETADDGDMFDLTPKPQSAGNASRKTVGKDYDESSEGTDTNVNSLPHKKGKGKLVAHPSSSRHDPIEYGPIENQESSRDLTYLSFLDGDEVAKLRRTLEQERIERKQKQAMGRTFSEDVAGTTDRVQPGNHTQESVMVPRKSSMKDLTVRSVKSNGPEDTVTQRKDASEHVRRHSETSILSARSHRSKSKADNLTSAFIIPDITIRATALAASEIPEPSKGHKAMLQDLAHHKGDNCTVCKRDGDPSSPQDHIVTIAKPLAVSDRKSTPGTYEEEPTVRPSQPPGLALATVIKDLEDEIAHLKIQFSKYQALYNGHDPALGKRKRKSVQQKMQNLLQAIDVKSDQIYALYDVLEGQKQAGHEMNDHEVEITLQSVGIDAASLHLRGGEAQEDVESKAETTNDRHPWDLSSEDESDEGLPWEGIESTVDTTRNGLPRSHRRRSVVA